MNKNLRGALVLTGFVGMAVLGGLFLRESWQLGKWLASAEAAVQDVDEREVAEMAETLEFQKDTAPELMGNLMLGPITTWIEAEGLFHEDAKPPWRCDILELAFPSSLGTISFTLPGAPEDGPRIEVNGVEHRLVKVEGGAE